MSRRPNTDKIGNAFSLLIKQAVWNKAQQVPGKDPSKFRKDHCGAWITFDQHGLTVENGNGWEIDHIKPVVKGGGDDLANLQPLQWQNNRAKGNAYTAQNYCLVSAKA